VAILFVEKNKSILTMMLLEVTAATLFFKLVCMLGVPPAVLCLLTFVALVLKLATNVLLFLLLFGNRNLALSSFHTIVQVLAIVVFGTTYE
jgi:hypothetical protein